MSKKTPSQDSNSDPRNEEDYDTWEYGTEPIPHDHTWTESNELEKVWKEMDEIEPLTPPPADVEDSYRAYKEAALSDAYMFGEYNGYEAYEEEE